MFKKVNEFLKGSVKLDVDASGNPTDEDILIATGVLLLQMAGSDADFAPEEVRTIFQVMKLQFNIEEGEVKSLLEQANSLREEKGKIDEFINIINANFNIKQRQRVLAMLWKVILADSKIDKFETRYATQLKFRLQLTDQEAKEAHEMALSGAV